MKKSKLKILAVICFISGILVLFFPQISNFINNYFMDAKTQEFDNYKESLENDVLDELYKKMKAHNEGLFKNGQNELVDPFSYEKSSFELSEYGLEEGIAGYIDIPKINVHYPIYLGANEENMSKGIAQLGETSLPIGGKNTNTVLAGHRGMKTKEMLLNIHKLEVGDEIIITNFHEKLYYKVSETKIIYPDEVSEILIQEDRELVTLMSCHPYPQNYERYLVFCERDMEKNKVED